VQGEILAQDFRDIATLIRKGSSFLTFMLTRCRFRRWLPNYPELFNVLTPHVEISASALLPISKLHNLATGNVAGGIWVATKLQHERFVMTGNESAGK